MEMSVACFRCFNKYCRRRSSLLFSLPREGLQHSDNEMLLSAIIMFISIYCTSNYIQVLAINDSLLIIIAVMRIGKAMIGATFLYRPTVLRQYRRSEELLLFDVNCLKSNYSKRT